MATGAPLPEEEWQRVVCRLCHHVFLIQVTGDSDEPGDLCQVCALMVERYGKQVAPSEAATQAGAPHAPEPRLSPPGERNEREQANLDSLWGHWQTNWNQEQHQASRKARLPCARRRKTTARSADAS